MNDFAVDQLSALPPRALDQHSTMTLAALGLTPGQMPQVRMLNTLFDQNGCLGGTLSLRYSGTGIGADGLPARGSGEDHEHDHDGSNSHGESDDGDDGHSGSSSLPRTGGDGHSTAIALAGTGLVALGSSTVYVLRRRKAQK